MFNILFGNRVLINPGPGGMRDVATAIISHEQTQSNCDCCFQTLDAVFLKDLFSDHFKISHLIFLSKCQVCKLLVLTKSHCPLLQRVKISHLIF